MTHIRKLRVLPQTTPLHGTITVPGDKSISHRAVMFAALAGHESHQALAACGRYIGDSGGDACIRVVVTVDEAESAAWNLTVAGRGLDGLQPPDQPPDCRNAGTCMRLLAGIMAGQGICIGVGWHASVAQSADAASSSRCNKWARILPAVTTKHL